MKEDKRKNNGGKRQGAGPPLLPEGEKKVQIIRYYKQSDIDKAGGKEAVKEILDKAFNTYMD